MPSNFSSLVLVQEIILNLYVGLFLIRARSYLCIPCISCVFTFAFFSQNEGEDFSYVIAFFLGTAACLYQVNSSCCTLQESSETLFSHVQMLSSFVKYCVYLNGLTLTVTSTLILVVMRDHSIDSCLNPWFWVIVFWDCLFPVSLSRDRDVFVSFRRLILGLLYDSAS